MVKIHLINLFEGVNFLARILKLLILGCYSEC